MMTDKRLIGQLAKKTAPLLLLLLFWWVCLTYLDRWPILHNDEVSLLAAGYQLFSQGVYGLDMQTGWYGREDIYLEVMPLMPWLQGLGSRLWGLGVWQMRLLPVISGLLTVALAFRLARRLAGWRTAVFTLLLLIFWQWAPGDNTFFGSGIALVDLSRIGRYDILLAPFSLSILLAWIAAFHSGKAHLYFLCGFLAGLAGLAHLYGLFWLAAIFIFWLGAGYNSEPGARSRQWQQLAVLLIGCFLAMVVWIIVILAHWAQFWQQFGFHQSRFNLSALSFYLNNAMTEGQRYFLGVREPESMVRIGFWLVIIGLPASLVWLGGRVWRRGETAAFWLLVPCLLFPLLFAFLVEKKQFAYLLLVMPLWVIVVAWGLSWLSQSSRLGWRLVSLIVVLLFTAEGIQAIRQMQQQAGITMPAAPFFAELQAVVPANGRIIGPQTYWLAWPDREYRSFVLMVHLAYAHNPAAISFDTALAQIQPDIMLLTPVVLEWARSEDNEAAFWGYMSRRQAQLIGEIPAYDGGIVQIYQLQLQSPP